MGRENATTWFLILWLAAAVVYDLWALWAWGADATLSRVLASHVREHPIVGVAIGVVIGHLFWRL